jgi:hypothetical protein
VVGRRDFYMGELGPLGQIGSLGLMPAHGSRRARVLRACTGLTLWAEKKVQH